MERELSIKLKYLNFFMSVLVVLIHSINNNIFIEKIFGQNGYLGQIAVPYFFMASGFLFFNNVYNIKDIFLKIRKRIWTILIPYFSWNVIYYLLNVFIKKSVYFSIIGLYDAALNHTYSSFMWFLYQLIIIVLITPIMYLILKSKFTTIITFLLLCAFVLFGIELKYFNIDSLIYYYFGGITSIYVINKKDELINKNNIIYPFFISIFFIIMKYLTHKIGYLYYFELLSIILLRISLSVFVFYFFDFIFKYKNSPKMLNNTFMLYMTHFMVVRLIFYATKIISINYSDFDMKNFEIIIFFITPIICIIFNNKFCSILKNKNPKYYNILSGGR